MLQHRCPSAWTPSWKSDNLYQCVGCVGNRRIDNTTTNHVPMHDQITKENPYLHYTFCTLNFTHKAWPCTTCMWHTRYSGVALLIYGSIQLQADHTINKYVRFPFSSPGRGFLVVSAQTHIIISK